MKELARRIEEMLIEITFAKERGIGCLKSISGRFTEWLDDLFTAITFAEIGEYDAARHFIGGGTGNNRPSDEYCLPGFCAGRA